MGFGLKKSHVGSNFRGSSSSFCFHFFGSSPFYFSYLGALLVVKRSGAESRDEESSGPFFFFLLFYSERRC